MKIERAVSKFLDSNVFAIKKNGQCIIVDAGCDLAQIKQMVGQNKVCGVFLTHGHYDHSLYVKDYANAFDCKVFASEDVVDTLSNGQANYSEGQFVIDNFDKFVFVKDGEEFTLGEFNVKCIEGQGHSKCSMLYLVENLLFAGDVLFESGIGRTDLLGGSRKQMYDTLCKLENLDFDVCYSGHGESSTKEKQSKNIALFKRFLSR